MAVSPFHAYYKRRMLSGYAQGGSRLCPCSLPPTSRFIRAEELMANLDKNAVAVQNSVYDHLIYDSSTIERPFAVALDNDPDVKMFFKIPGSFKIETPIGTYNPDWAVYLDRDGVKKMYFVLETKGSTSMFDLRTAERLKIHCGK